MSYEIIEKTVFGVIVTKQERSCKTCKYFEKSFSWCSDNCECDTLERYLTEQEEQEYYSSKEAAKLESEISPETFTINDMYVTSKQLFNCQDELKASQKELIDLRCELRVEKEKSKALEEYSRGLELKVKELENSFKQNIIDFVIWYREDNMSSYTPEHLAEWYLSVKNQK